MGNIVLIVGDDPILLSRKVDSVVSGLALHASAVLRPRGDAGSALATTSLFDPELAVVLTEMSATDSKAVTAYLDDPRDDMTVIISSTKPVAALRKKVVAAGGQVHEVLERSARDTVLGLIGERSLSLTAPARNLIVESAGETPAVALAILDRLEQAYPVGARLDTDEVAAWVYETGAKTLWSLLDAIDSQNLTLALNIFERCWANERPVTIAMTLKGHLEKMFRLSSAGITDEKVGAEFLRGKSRSTYPAKKAIQLARRYRGAVEPLLMLATQADAALRGGRGSGVPDRIILEVLIARMCTYPRK